MNGDPAVAVAEASTRRFASLLRTLPDPHAKAVGDWSVRDVASHAAGGFAAYVSILRGQGSPVVELDEIAEWNAGTIASADERDLGVLAARIDAVLDEALAVAGATPGDTIVAWHGGLQVPLSTAWSVLAGEALVHGYDVARAANKPWPMPRNEIRTVLLGLLPVLPYFVDPSEAAGLCACVDLRLRGDRDARAFLVFDDGRLVIERSNGRRVDCHISADPAAYLLVAYGRMSPLRPAVTGKIVAWGRRPQLAFRLNRVFKNP